MRRRYSLDSSDSPLGPWENGGRTKETGSRRASEAPKRGTLDEANLQIVEFNRMLNQRALTRQQTIEEESLDLSDGIITHHRFESHKKTFRKVFPEIPEEEDLTQAFTCALQKEVLYHGKMYVSSQHVCFYSSVLLKATKVIIEAESIQAVRKKNAAKVLPNALSIITNNGDKFMFVSLRNRDVCFRLLLTVCPQIQVTSEMNGTQISPASFDPEMDMISNYSSQDESLSRRTSVDEPLPFGSSYTYADLSKPSLEWPRTRSTRRRSSISKDGQSTEDEDAAGGWWMSFEWEKIKSIFTVRESRMNSLIILYVLLVVLLLLSSGYIGLRMVALEEHLSALSSVQEEYKET